MIASLLLRCTGVQDTLTTNYCEDDNSVSTLFSDTSCALSIGNAKPEHTGQWKLNALGFQNANTDTAQVIR